MSAAAADDFCDCPERAYLGTGWVEETEDSGRRDSSSISNLSQRKGREGANGSFNVALNKKKNPVGVSFLKNEKWPAKCFKSVLSCLGQKAEQSPWVVRDPCLQSLCLCGDKINSFQRDALCTSLSCRHTLPGLGVETSPSSKLSANRPPSPFCTCAVDVL